MHTYMVYTANGDWKITAASAEAAKRQVYNITFGRCGIIDNVRRVD